MSENEELHLVLVIDIKGLLSLSLFRKKMEFSV